MLKEGAEAWEKRWKRRVDGQSLDWNEEAEAVR